MKKYARIIDSEAHSCEVALGDATDYFESIGMTLMDVEQGYDGIWYITGYAPTPPEPSLEEQEQAIRNERDRRLTQSDWVNQRQMSQTAAGITPSLSKDQFRKHCLYQQTLRDITKERGFPWGGDISQAPWPPVPEYLEQ